MPRVPLPPARPALLLAVAALLAGPLLPAAAGAAPARADWPAAPAVPPPPSDADCRSWTGAGCLAPAQLLAAYGVDRLHDQGLDGRGRTICLAESFGSPTLQRDLAAFSAATGLPPARVEQVVPAGRPPAARTGAERQARLGWAAETSLDAQWAHAVAPAARLVVVAGPVDETEGEQGFPELAVAVQRALARAGCDVLSLSMGATEQTFRSAASVRALSRALVAPAVARGVTVVASSGDAGAVDLQRDGQRYYRQPVTSWPASDPGVTAVGGTRLAGPLDGPDGRARDDAWGGGPGTGAGGGGRSVVFPRPRWQDAVRAVTGRARGVPDVSLDAAPESGLLTAESFWGDGRTWTSEAGTSAAAPLFAGLVALADQAAGRRAGLLGPLLYGPLRAPGHGLVDVVRGRTDLRGQPGAPPLVRGWPARTGYDLATGLGTVDASALVPALAAAVRARR